MAICFIYTEKNTATPTYKCQIMFWLAYTVKVWKEHLEWDHTAILIFINGSYDIIRNKLFRLPRYREIHIYSAEDYYKVLHHMTVFSTSQT